MAGNNYDLSHLDRAVRLRGRLSGDKIAEFYNARAALEEHEPAFEKIWNESGLGKAEDAFEEMNCAYFGAEMALLSSRPTTQAGAMALLRFIPEHLEGPHIGAEDSEQRVATAIRAAVAVLEREGRS